MSDFDAILSILRTYEERIRTLEEKHEEDARSLEYVFLCREIGNLRSQLDSLRPGWDQPN